MIIYFKTNKLQKICNSQKEAEKKHGLQMAKKLMRRLNELQAAKTLQDISYLPPSRCHELTGPHRGNLSVDLEHPYRLLFIPANDPVPTKSAGGLDWSKVTEVEITEITNTHE